MNAVRRKLADLYVSFLFKYWKFRDWLHKRAEGS
jgi:hypothetical protein